jgi:hypothetical protein
MSASQDHLSPMASPPALRAVEPTLPTTLLQRIQQYEVLGRSLDEEILIFLNTEVSKLHCRDRNGVAYRITHVTFQGRNFQLNLQGGVEVTPLTVPARTPTSTGTFSKLGEVLESIRERLSVDIAIGGDLQILEVEGGYDLVARA